MPGRKTPRAKAGEPACGAQIRKGPKAGTQCDRPAGFGTSHAGAGYCRIHGGELAQNLWGSSAHLSLLVDEPVDVDPIQALLWCVALAKHEVEWINGQIAAASVQGSEPYGSPQTVKETERTVADGEGMGSHLEPSTDRTFHPVEAHVLVRDRRDALERLARFSKMAIDAGIAERMVRMAERIGELMAPILAGIFGDSELALTAKQHRALPAVTRRHMALLEGGRQEEVAS